MNADGKAKAVSDTTDTNGESVKQAIAGCPVAAIRETE
jgi:ferredoxin